MVTTRNSTRLAASTREVDPPRPAKRLKTTVAADETSAEVVVEHSNPDKKIRKTTGRTKSEPKPEDYRVRVTSPWKVGAHVSAAGGVENAIQNAAELG
jgi:AP endonuclease 1